MHIFPSGDHSIPLSEVNNITIPFVSDFLYTTLDCYEGTNIKESQLNLEVYPNPARDVLNVVVSDLAIDMQVLNMLGERLALTVIDGKIDVSDLASGLYCLELKTRDKAILTKFVKQ